jgi:hypothetical protein
MKQKALENVSKHFTDVSHRGRERSRNTGMMRGILEK